MAINVKNEPAMTPQNVAGTSLSKSTTVTNGQPTC